LNYVVERTNGSWPAVCLYVIHMEELFYAYWTGELLICATSCNNFTHL